MLTQILFLTVAVTAPQSMTMEEVDREILQMINGAHGGFLLHGPTHTECGIKSRRRALQDRVARYERLESEFAALGGVLPTDYEIMTETVHYRCAGKRSQVAARWEAAIREIDDRLRRMEALVARKRQLGRN